jgi:hypothetical protein
MINISELMNTLSRQRKVYHSEADFQHAFAWKLHQQLPESSVRLEKLLRPNGEKQYLDFLIQLSNKSMAVELKYKTRKLVLKIENEDYSLTNQGAQDQGRYDFIKDIVRLENITSNLDSYEGYAVLLTNDSSYWKPRLKTTVDEAFSLTENRTLSGSMAWTEGASEGTKKNRTDNLLLSGAYKLNWQDFSVASTESFGQFRYLAVHVPSKSL